MVVLEKSFWTKCKSKFFLNTKTVVQYLHTLLCHSDREMINQIDIYNNDMIKVKYYPSTFHSLVLQNYYGCGKLTKVKKIHNFMLNDFREIISQHHNMPQVAVLPMDSAVFVQICQIKCVV